jgi:ATP/maltotriose-dependent transcriptional regulator MalT
MSSRKAPPLRPHALRLAKLTPPQAAGLLPRPRLFERLDALRGTPMVWIAAAPGAGKTSLAASWLHARERSSLWMQIDAADADPASFFHYLSLAAQALADDPSPLPTFTPDHAKDPLPFARRYFRALFQRLPEATVLTFDNVQEVGAEAALPALLAVMLEEQPAGFQMLAISRHEPPAALARARAALHVAVVDGNDLRFQPDEARAVAERGGVASAAQVERVLAQSQGWAAGIVLLLEALRRSPELGSAGNPAGATTAVFDYFATQVLDAAPAAARRTMLRLAYLPRMTSAMAVAISGDPAAGPLLEGLVARHLFTDRRFEPEPTYQFHALFRAFLQARARDDAGPQGDREGVLCAARLLAAVGQDSDAFAAFTQAAAWDEAAALTLACAEALVAAGRHQTLAGWIESLPQAMRRSDPWLGYWLGIALTGRDARASREALSHALAQFDQAGDREGQVRAITAMLAGWWNEPEGVRWLEPHTQRLAALLADDDGLGLAPHTLAAGLVVLTLARLMIRPADPGLARLAERVAALPLDELPPALALGAGTCLLQFHWGEGRTDACEAAIRRTRAIAERPDLPPGERMWFWFWLMTHQVYMANPTAARDAMAQARSLEDEARRAPPFLDFVRWDVTLEMQQGRIREARELLSQQLEPQRERASAFTQACIDLEWVRCANEEGRFDEAIARGQRAMQVCAAAGHDWLRVVLGLSVCCAQALGGKVDEGFGTLAELKRLSAETLPIMMASVSAYEALLHLRAGAPAAAREALDRCMALRGDTAYVWGPGWNRPAIAALAAFALGEGRHVPAMKRFVRGLRLAPPAPDLEAWPWPVRLCVLDGFSIEIDGDAHAWRRRKSPQRLLELLKAVATMGGREVPAERLCDALWPDADGDAAQRSLDTALSRLRRLLGHDEALQLRAGKVSLNPRVVSLDLWTFEQRLQSLASIAVSTPTWAEQAERTLAVYRTPLLCAEPAAPWLLDGRERWRRRWLEPLNQLAAHYHLTGQVDLLDRLIENAERVEQGSGAERALPAELVRLGARYRSGSELRP